MRSYLLLGHELRQRLALALQLSPALLTPACWCGDPPDGEHTIQQLEEMQDLIRLGLAKREAGCFPYVTGNLGGAGGADDGGPGGAGPGGAGLGGLGGMGGALGTGGVDGTDGAGGGTGEGRPAICDVPFPSWVTGNPSHWDEGSTASALSWDPQTGCPTPAMYDAITHPLVPEMTQSLDLLSSEDGVCIYDRIKFCNGGRPFLVGQEARVATMCERGAAQKTGSGTRQAVAEAWLADALVEHASIAAFARLALQLMAHGAPLELVLEAQEASLDEGRHAAFCLQQARQHTKTEPNFGPLRMGDVNLSPTAEELLVTNIIEGCIGEMLAAARARVRAEQAGSKSLRAGLIRIAEDEERHAALGWRILRWQLGQHPALAEVALAAFQRSRPLASSSAPTDQDPKWTKAGLLCAHEGASVDLATWQTAVAPLAAQLLTMDERRERSGFAAAPERVRVRQDDVSVTTI